MSIELLPGLEAAQPEHCIYAFDVLFAKLSNETPPTPPVFSQSLTAANNVDADSGPSYPLFVTWNIRSSSSSTTYKLRGCIGTFTAMPLVQGLAEYAVISYASVDCSAPIDCKDRAIKDTRFNPISLSELPRLQCGSVPYLSFAEFQMVDLTGYPS